MNQNVAVMGRKRATHRRILWSLNRGFITGKEFASPKADFEIMVEQPPPPPIRKGAHSREAEVCSSVKGGPMGM